AGLEMANIFDAASGEVIQEDNVIAAFEKPLGEMGTNETGAAGDEITQRASLENLGIVVAVPRGFLPDRFRLFIVIRVHAFLRSIPVRVRIVAVGIIIVGGAGIHGIENDAQQAAFDANEQVTGARKGLLGSFAAADDEEDPIGLDGDNDGVGSGHDGRRIDDDELEFGAQLGDGVGEFMGGEQIGRIGGERSGGNGGEIRNSRMRNSDEIEAGSSGEIRTEPGISVAGETENASDARLAEVGIDEDGAVAQLGESDGEIGGSRGFAFAGKGAGDEDDLGRVIGLRKQDGCASGAKRFGHLRFGQMLRDKLDASLVAVARDAVEKSAALAIAVAGGELGNDGERRQTSEIFDVVGTLDGVVEIFAKYGESNASHEANKKSEHEIAGFGGAG